MHHTSAPSRKKAATFASVPRDLLSTWTWLVMGLACFSNAAPVTYQYDALGHLTNAVISNAAAVSYSHDAGSNLTQSGVTSFVPQLAVEQPVSMPLTNGGPALDFGTVSAGATASLTITIRNTGTADLALGTITKSGAGDEGFFVVAPPAASTVAPGASTTFTVQFTPATAGVKTAVIHIPSNDNNAPSIFDINLTGTGQSAGVLAFGGTFYTVIESSNPVTVNVPIVRTVGSHGTVTVNVSTSNGIGTGAATAGLDYTQITNQVITFNEGDLTGSVDVTILPDAVANEPNETLTLTLSSPTGGASLGATKTATVRIVDVSGDAGAPAAPTVALPAANAVVGVDTGGTLLITGTAKDDKGIGSVVVTLNSDAPIVSTNLVITGSSAAYSVPVTPVTGLNTVSIVSRDTAGLFSPPVTRSFIVARPLRVNLAGSGSVNKGFSPISYQQVGKTISLTASPAKGFIFSGWDATAPTSTGISAAAKELPALSFVFQEGLVLTAKFTANPYALLAGTYNGLIHADPLQPAPSGTTAGAGTEGFLTASVTATGSLTGKLSMDGLTFSITAAFDSNGAARFGKTRDLTLSLPRPGKQALILALNINAATPGVDDKITGTVTETVNSVLTATSNVTAERGAYDGKIKAAPNAYLTLSGSAAANGSFTAVFPAKDLAEQPAGFTTSSYPQGDGFAVVTLTKSGTATLTGMLADGTAITGGALLSRDNAWPLFAQLYNKRGILSARVEFGLQFESDLSASDVLWFRPAQDVQYYPNGWPQGVKVDLLGAKFSAPAADSILPYLTTPNRLADLAISDGLLTTTIHKAVSISVKDMVAKVSPMDASFSLTITRASGKFAGIFTHEDGSKPAFQGIIYQKGSRAGGYGYFLSTAPKTKDYKGESGGVSLTAQ